MRFIEILGINVKLIEEVKSYSFFRRIDKKIYRLNPDRNLHLEKLQQIHTHCTDVQNRIIRGWSEKFPT